MLLMHKPRSKWLIYVPPFLKIRGRSNFLKEEMTYSPYIKLDEF